MSLPADLIPLLAIQTRKLSTYILEDAAPGNRDHTLDGGCGETDQIIVLHEVAWFSQARRNKHIYSFLRGRIPETWTGHSCASAPVTRYRHQRRTFDLV